MKPMKPCNHAGCSALTYDTYCEDHLKKKRKQHDDKRGTASQRGYNYRWSKYRTYFLNKHPLCMCPDCKEKAVPLPANVVDHITPHRGDYNLFWDETNHQAMNKKCHDKKTAKEDGGFGNEQANRIH